MFGSPSTESFAFSTTKIFAQGYMQPVVTIQIEWGTLVHTCMLTDE